MNQYLPFTQSLKCVPSVCHVTVSHRYGRSDWNALYLSQRHNQKGWTDSFWEQIAKVTTFSNCISWTSVTHRKNSQNFMVLLNNVLRKTEQAWLNLTAISFENPVFTTRLFEVGQKYFNLRSFIFGWCL